MVILFDDSTRNKLILLIYRYRLARCYGSLWNRKKNFDTTFAILDTFDILIVLTISDLRFRLKWKCSSFSSPMPINGTKFGREKLQFRFCSDCYSIVCNIFPNDKKSWTATHLDSSALTDSITECSFVYSENLSSSIEDISRFFREALF